MLSGTYLHDLTNLTILAYLVCQFFSVFSTAGALVVITV